MNSVDGVRGWSGGVVRWGNLKKRPLPFHPLKRPCQTCHVRDEAVKKRCAGPQKLTNLGGMTRTRMGSSSDWNWVESVATIFRVLEIAESHPQPH